MNPTAANILVSVTPTAVLVKISGRANFAASCDFKTLLNELHRRRHSTFILDVSDCALMDSTFLGVLAGFGMKSQGSPDGLRVELLNPPQRITDLLENLGVIDLFKIARCGDCLPDPDAMTPVAATDHSKLDVSRTCLEAHETLMSLSPENAARFKDVARFLAEDLKRLEASGQG